jgi:hypothetical protein
MHVNVVKKFYYDENDYFSELKREDMEDGGPAEGDGKMYKLSPFSGAFTPKNFKVGDWLFFPGKEELECDGQISSIEGD